MLLNVKVVIRVVKYTDFNCGWGKKEYFVLAELSDVEKVSTVYHISKENFHEYTLPEKLALQSARSHSLKED